MSKVLYLTGDIGGTNARLALWSRDVVSGEEVKVGVHKYSTKDFDTFEACVDKFLSTFNTSNSKVTACCIAIAGPIIEDTQTHDQTSIMTNHHWKMSRNALKDKFKFTEAGFINDFAAVGYALPALTKEDYFVLNEGKKVHGKPIACLGAGTGLGEVFCTFNGTEYDPWSTEGGHTDYAAKNDKEYQLLRHVIDEEKKDRVSVERVTCGSGLIYIYNFLKKSIAENPEIATQLAAKSADQGRIISENGLKPDYDPLCHETMMMFLRNYWSEAGNLALKTLPFGGLFFAGGIAPKIKSSIIEHKEELMSYFFEKGRMKKVLVDVPVYVVTHESIGELGAQVYARRLLKQCHAGEPSSSGASKEDNKFFKGFFTGALIASAVTAAAAAVFIRSRH